MNTKLRFGILALTASIWLILPIYAAPRAAGFFPTASINPYNLALAQSDTPPPPEPVILTDQQNEYPLGLHLEILEDPNGKLTIEDISSLEFETRFVPSQVEVPNYGFTDSAYWVRLRLDNQTRNTDEWLLEQSWANTHFVDLYSPLPDRTGYSVKHTGVLRPAATRDVRYHRIIFILAIPPGSQQTYYLRFQNGASMTLSLTLWAQDAFLNHALVEQMFMAIFFGVLIGLLFYHLFLLYSFREANYLYFVIVLASLILEEAVFEGYWVVYGFSNYTIPIQKIQSFAYWLVIASVVLFSDTFLELNKRHPKLHQVNLVILTIGGLLLVLIPFTSYHSIAIPMVIWGLISLIAVLVAGLASWLGGFRSARFFLLAWIGLLVGVFWLLLIRTGLLSSTFLSENLFRLGFMWLAVSWSIALADRINLLKAETEKANLNVQASEARYRQLVETMSDGVGVIDEEGRFTYLNNQLAEMLGYPAEEIIGHLVTEFVDEDNRQILAGQLEKRSAGSSDSYELTWKREDEDEIFTHISPVPLFEDGRRYKGSIAVITDITERVKARRILEQRVNDRTHELTTLLEVSRDIAVMQELETVINRILERLKTVVNYHTAIILAEKEDHWSMLAEDQPALSIESEPVELSPPEVQALVKDFELGEPVLIRNSDLDKANYNGFGTLAARLSRRYNSCTSCWLGVPLFEKGNLSGALLLGCEEAETSTDHVKIVAAFANQIAIAIENNHLYQQVRETAVIEERNRLARDLHDSVTQALFSASLIADILPQRLRRDPELALQSGIELRRLTRGALAEMRTLLLELRPASITNTPLGDLLSQLTEAVTSRSEVHFQLYIDNLPPLPAEIQTTFYRIAQEALNNIVKHAQARQVIVSLSATPPIDARSVEGWKGIVRLIIRDDGIGFATGDQAREQHMGLGIMRERAAAINAILTIMSQPGGGTAVTLIW